jgi:hypothetical protein
VAVSEYSLGDPALGWHYDGTMLNATTPSKWARQVSNPNHDAACYFAPDGKSIETYLRPADLAYLSGGARTQIIRGYDVDILAGYWISGWCWTRSDYKPQTSRTWPNWNAFGFCNHDGGYKDSAGGYHSAPQAYMGMGVYTFDTARNVALAQPRIGVACCGGDDWVTWYNNRKIFLYPDAFVPGKTYYWDYWCKDGEIEMWIDGVQWIPRTAVPLMWKKPKGIAGYADAVDPGVRMGAFAVQENYRPANETLAKQNDIQVTWDMVMRFGPIRVGDSRAETTYNAAAPAPTPPPTPAPVPTAPLSSVRIVTPAVGGTKDTATTVSGAVTWEAKVNAGAESNTQRIEFRVDAQLGGTHSAAIWTEHNAPYICMGDGNTYDTHQLPNGRHRLGVRAYRSLTDTTPVTAAGWINVQN